MSSDQISTEKDLFAIVVAAGEGHRLGRHGGKAGVMLLGEPMVVWSLRAVNCAPQILGGVLVTREEEVDTARRDWLTRGVQEPRSWRVVSGGATRSESVAVGLAQVPEQCFLVLVHDAARPLLAQQDLEHVVAVARNCGAAILASPVADTLKRVQGDTVRADVDRSGLWQAETPQVMRRDWLQEACQVGDPAATDEAGWLTARGRSVRVVESLMPNLKVTRSCDLQLVEALLGQA